MEEIEFKCPKCGHNIVEEVMVNACVSSTIANIYPEELEYLNCYEVHSGDVDRYQCTKCGYIIAKTIEELYESCEKLNKLISHEL